MGARVCVTVLHTTDHFESTTLTTVKAPEDGTHGVPEHIGGGFVHQLCIHSSACKDGFIS
jgi:hypothetical protein